MANHEEEDRKVCNIDYQILFYVPNIIGYIRIIFLTSAWFYMTSVPKIFLAFYVISVILDVTLAFIEFNKAFDGITARKLNQTSTFGAWFDVVIDNFGRGFLWSHIFKWGYFVSAFEWLVFVCTHTHGAKWKNSGENIAPPFWVKAVMADNFKTIVGFYAISGLHILPIWLYSLHNLTIVQETISIHVITAITVVLASGRLTCVSVEGWFIWTHIKSLLTNFND